MIASTGNRHLPELKIHFFKRVWEFIIRIARWAKQFTRFIVTLFLSIFYNQCLKIATLKKITIAFYNLIKEAVSEFIEDNALKLSASLSFYTIFSIAPMLIIIISLAGIFFGAEAVEGKIYGQIKSLVGSDAALQIQDIIKNIKTTGHNSLGAVIGLVILFVATTGVFTEIQDSINYIWSVKAKPKRGWLKILRDRGVSFSIIISMGFIMLVSLLVSAFLDLMSERLQRFFDAGTVQIFHLLNLAVVMVVITGLFSVIFKVLPDAIIRWRDAFIGACFTSVLFLIGKFLIGLYLGNSTIGITYGTAASVVIILLWVYYSSIILFFGAEFTKVYALRHGSYITPKSTAVYIINQESLLNPHVPRNS